MRIEIPLADKYEFVYQISYYCEVNGVEHIDQINIF